MSRDRAGARARGIALALLCLVQSPVAAQATTDPYIAEPPYLYLNDAGYRAKRYRGPTPAAAPVGGTLDTAALAALLESRSDVVLIDVQAVTVRPETADFGISWLPSETRYHLPGSSWLPNVGAGELDERMDAYFRRELSRLTDADTARPVVLYCVLDCWMSWNAVQRAHRYGYHNVHWYRDGTDGWEAAGHELVEGTPREIEDE